MPYLGTQAPTGFKTTTKQSFSGDNSTTAFTLNRASSSNTALEVFVDNIQQEPTTAYSVSGTTLTFTEAPPTGTNNVYVVNRGGDQNGLLPRQDLGTTDYIFGDDISFNSDSAKLNFGADSEITLTHVHNTGLQLNSTNKIMFGDTASFIQQSSDGVLRIDGETTIDLNGALVADGGAVFNEDSADVDFRVESNGEANMLFVDGGNDRVGIGTTGGSGETLTVTKSGADATVRINGVASQEAALKLQGNNTVTNTFKIASEEDDSGLTIQKWNGSAYVTHIASSANGEVTKPLQPAFLAGPLTGASAQSGLAVGSDVTIIVGNEIYDVNGDFTSNTFTAPVTGKYHLSANITYNHFDEDSTQIQSGIKTSNRDYINQFDPDAFQEDADIITMTLTVVADMDANDTAFVFYNQTGGSAQVNVGKETTTFSGCLLA